MNLNGILRRARRHLAMANCALWGSKLAGAKVKVNVVGVDGRVVATSGAVAREGSNAVSMKKPKQGVYFVRLKVGSQTAVNRVLVH